jgi:hypothetical protein
MLRVVGAGLPRTATRSLKQALERLLGGRCYHMPEVFQHLEDVPTWRAAIRGEEVDWSSFPPDCVAAVDWPASAFWRELAGANPDALIVLSTRDSATQCGARPRRTACSSGAPRRDGSFSAPPSECQCRPSRSRIRTRARSGTAIRSAVASER